MAFLPRLKCPGCGKTIHGIQAKEIPPAEKFEDCLRRCNKCKIGASNAKNPAKVKFIYVNPPAEISPPVPEAAPQQTPDDVPGDGEDVKPS